MGGEEELSRGGGSIVDHGLRGGGVHVHLGNREQGGDSL